MDKDKVAAVTNWEPPRISREFSSFWALPTTTTDSSLILLRWLPPLVTYYLIRRNSSGVLSSNVLLTP